MAGRNDLRERILDAAAQVLREHGPRPRLITTIAERAQVSRPTLYRHFRDRTELYDSLMRVEVHRAVEEVVQRAETSTDPFRDYVTVVVDIVMEAREHPAMRAILARHPEILNAQLPRLLPIVLETAEPRLTPIIRARVAAGVWPDVDPRVAITWTTRLIVSFITMPLPEDSTRANLQATVESVLDIASTISRSHVDHREP
ncbi:TetR/AcrR family transcriptional regulator [Nocardioides jejuensis]|uniref:TetR/AcrR family transcriptional regulator n=1 Tax=Nocardioides jejuensis TaxID=2502782 RepID=A0A4R1CI35_9ACTN|nr:TetR/AcrR family transcriptional regulator [Nocardioides jejuensis]TCJ30869.1 TetR/AcrR family transcriptional regulator [Nocardioides jejuensis]